MKQVLLDTNFILSCVKQKIDFFEELFLEGFEIIIPEEVIDEIKNVERSKQKLKEKEIASLSLRILDKNKFKKISLGFSYVDDGILNYIKKDNEIYVATIDKELKNKIKNRKIVIREKKRLEVIP